MAVLRSRKQRGSGAAGVPLSYINSRHVEPSASVGSNIQISEPGLVRPILNPTGGKRSYIKRSYKRRSYSKRSYKQRGSGAVGAPFSYVNSKYSEASASAGSDIQISEPGLVRPVLNPTGGRRSRRHRGGAATPPIASSASPVLVVPTPAPPPPVCAPAPPVPCTPPPPPMPPPTVSDSACPCSGKITGGRRSRRGGFYPSVMGNFIGNASRLVPAVAITGYRMVKNNNKTRRNRK